MEPAAALTSADVKALMLHSYDLAMLASAAKYDIDQKEHRVASNKALVRLFFNLAGRMEIDLFVEAGAKDAFASRRAKRRFADARVVAFEANPYTYAEFRQLNEDSEVEYLHRALTDNPGPVTFNVLRNQQGVPLGNGQASILKREKTGDADRGYEEVTVEGITLDSFFADTAFERAAVWVDVEGACQYVLGGAPELLAKTSVLIVEVEDENWWGEGHWLREQVVSHLYDAGLVPVARDYEFVHQYNIVFVRADALVGANKVRWALARFASEAYPSAKPVRKPKPAPPAPSLLSRVRRRFRR